jgi:hydroxymethylbilane synthase
MTDPQSSLPTLKLGTRSSPLAMAQAEEARARLCAAHGWDIGMVELVPVKASGDKIQDRALADLGGKALWTRELDQWLADGKIDAAVHSMKDVETLRPETLAIAAILPRADKADCLLGAASIDALPKGANIGTSAPRRAAQLLHLRPDCSVSLMRGNVATRLEKLASDGVDATFLAAAGLNRLGIDLAGDDVVHTQLDESDWLPAPAQGAIGLECRSDDDETCALLAEIDHAESRAEVMAERALLQSLGGSCHSPIGVLATYAEGHVSMRAAIWSEDGQFCVKGAIDFAHDFGETDFTGAHSLAKGLLERAPESVAKSFADNARSNHAKAT